MIAAQRRAVQRPDPPASAFLPPPAPAVAYTPPPCTLPHPAGLGNLGDLVNVTFVSMQLQLASASGFSLGCSGSGSQLASPATVTSLATSYIT